MKNRTANTVLEKIHSSLAVNIEELAASGWLKEDVETVLRYKDVIKQALRSAVAKARSCVLRYERIADEIYVLMSNDDEAWRTDISFYSILILAHVKIDDVVVHKIYADGNEGADDVLAVLFGGKQLTKRQIELLKEVAQLLSAKFYDKFDDKEEKFYDATPISRHKRNEVYTVVHNLVNTWTNCRGVIRDEEEEQ